MRAKSPDEKKIKMNKNLTNITEVVNDTIKSIEEKVDYFERELKNLKTDLKQLKRQLSFLYFNLPEKKADGSIEWPKTIYDLYKE